MGSREQAERLQILVTERDRQIAELQKENAELREKVEKRGKKLKAAKKEIKDADPLYVKGYTRKDGVYVKPYRKKVK